MHNLNVYKALLKALRVAEPELAKAARLDPERKAKDTIGIMRGAQTQLDVLGINALRPAHEGIEPIARIIDNDGGVEFVVMDPFCPAFRSREKYEKDDLGRLQSEMEAAILGLADACRRSTGDGDLDIYFHTREPKLSLVIGDRNDPENGIAQVNLYTGGKGIRGLSGKTYVLAADTQSSAEGDAFAAASTLFREMVKDSQKSIPDGEPIYESARRFLTKSKIHWLGKYSSVEF